MANLRPPFQPGNEIGKLGGRKSAGITMREWLNVMVEWPLERIKKVSESDRAPAVQRAAARVWIDACSTQKNASGMPIAGPDFDRICDRTEGKPTQALELTGKDGAAIQVEDLSALPVEDLAKLREIRLKLAGADPGGN